MPPITTSDSQAQDNSSSTLLKERRFKLSRACDRCRRRRIKCDEGHPCQACLTANSACTFEEPGKRTHPHKSKRTATLEDRMHHLETLIQAIPPAVFAAGAGNMALNTALNPASDSSNKATSPIAPYMLPQPPGGVPPPSLHLFPLINPSTHFAPSTTSTTERQSSPNSTFHSLIGSLSSNLTTAADQLAEETSRMSLSQSYLYFDDEGYTRWQGETSGLPLLDILLERHMMPATKVEAADSPPDSTPTESDWFPNRVARKTADANPEVIWRLITSYIAPELMDSLVQCYLSTSYYILPFLHVPTFLADYGNPQKWGEPGFATFIVAICCLASRHMDDPRVRANPSEGITAGTQWFELLGRLRTLPIADRPTLYTIQANLIAAVYATGLGRLSKAAALLSEAITVSIDTGLHRSADTYDLFDPIEDEVRKRTFWCVYIWDKQLSAHFGRPPMIRLRDCDVGEPAPVDDEYITKESIGVPPPGTECRMSAFVCSLRLMVVLESVLDIPPPRTVEGMSPFLLRAAGLSSRKAGFNELREEEALLDEVHASIPPFWAHSPETLATEDTIRLTQAGRLLCAEHFVRLLIYRHRFTQLVAERSSKSTEEMMCEKEKEAVIAAHSSALLIVTAHLNIARRGLMTYYGVHVIHQLTQAGRTLVAILLNCKTEVLQHLIPSGLDALRSCVGLLRRFSGRYVCGLRSGDLMEEFCRLTQIPLETNRQENPVNEGNRPPWIRPVRKKTMSASVTARSSEHGSSPESFSQTSPTFVDPPKGAFGSSPPPSSSPAFTSAGSPTALPPSGLDQNMGMDPQMYMSPSEVLALFNDNGVDVGQIFGSDLDTNVGGGGFGSPSSFIKMDGVVTSPS